MSLQSNAYEMPLELPNPPESGRNEPRRFASARMMHRIRLHMLKRIAERMQRESLPQRQTSS